jgi:hypothetical protein
VARSQHSSLENVSVLNCIVMYCSCIVVVSVSRTCVLQFVRTDVHIYVVMSSGQ